MIDYNLLKPIDEVLNESLPVNIKEQFAGRVEQFYDPQARRPGLKYIAPSGKAERYTLDSIHYDLQVAHRLTGGQHVKSPAQFGSRQKVAFNLDWTLICATKRPEILTSFLLAFNRLQEVEIREFNTDTLSILKSESLFIPSDKSPYDHLLQSFSIRYTMLSISDNIISLLCNPLY
ncbi:hypothetical protein BH09BAC4_BH09BAC4_28190 [soil metagenome]